MVAALTQPQYAAILQARWLAGYVERQAARAFEVQKNPQPSVR